MSNYFDVLLVLILQNLESRISNSERRSLLDFGLDILPHTSVSTKLEDHYRKLFTMWVSSINLLNEDELDNSTPIVFENQYDSEFLISSKWFRGSYYIWHKNSLCYPDSFKLKTYNLDESGMLVSELAPEDIME